MAATLVGLDAGSHNVKVAERATAPRSYVSVPSCRSSPWAPLSSARHAESRSRLGPTRGGGSSAAGEGWGTP